VVVARELDSALLLERPSHEGQQARNTNNKGNNHNHNYIMNIRQQLQVLILLLLTLFAFASYHSGTGGTGWLQFLSTIVILAFLFVFDLAFTGSSSFIFDPDADNWRRKVVRKTQKYQQR
jgi:hypothetical protein